MEMEKVFSCTVTKDAIEGCGSTAGIKVPAEIIAKDHPRGFRVTLKINGKVVGTEVHPTIREGLVSLCQYSASYKAIEWPGSTLREWGLKYKSWCRDAGRGNIATPYQEIW